MIWIVIGEMFINQSFTKNKAVINGKTVSFVEARRKSPEVLFLYSLTWMAFFVRKPLIQGTTACTLKTKQHSTIYNSCISFNEQYLNDSFPNYTTKGFVHNCSKLISSVVIETTLVGKENLKISFICFEQKIQIWPKLVEA